MSLNFAINRTVGPSGVNIALIDIPALNPEQNISIIDKSYLWEENVANIDSGMISSYVTLSGEMQKMTITDFLVTNVTMGISPDSLDTPLFYRHLCRFYHYSYGDDPSKHVYITDENENILKNINYKAWTRRLSKNVYEVQVLTDFKNNDYVSYKVKYNRTDSTGSYVLPSWSEILNAEPLFNYGNPFSNLFAYTLSGPDNNGLYNAIVPPVPTLSNLINRVGVSFNLSPTFIEGDPTNLILYTANVTYTLSATGPSTFIVSRDRTPSGVITSDLYLQAATGSTWGASPVNFTIGTVLYFDCVKVSVNSDSYLNTNDICYFIASRPYYYLKPINFKSIYLAKPTNVQGDDDWFIKIKAGSFSRRMDASGNVVPTGQGTAYQYYVSEYDESPWNITYGKPYIQIPNESPLILDKDLIRTKHTPLLITPSGVLGNGGFPPSGYLTVWVNDKQLAETEILDWELYSGTIKIAKLLGVADVVTATYTYKEDYYIYKGFYGSGCGTYPTTPPFPWFPMDFNPTPMHNYTMYASGITAYIYVSPSWNLDTKEYFNLRPCYHNFTGQPSGVYDFCLGGVSIGPNCKYSDVTVTDTRTRGGGLKDDIDFEAVQELQPESKFYWDIGYFDGQAFPSNGVLVVQLPKALQSRDSEAREKVNRHLAMGEYAIIDYV